jgi:sterol O-acyltransferase
LATFGTLSLILIVTEHYIYPSIERLPGQTFLVSWLDLVPPFVLNFLLIFFISALSVPTHFPATRRWYAKGLFLPRSTVFECIVSGRFSLPSKFYRADGREQCNGFAELTRFADRSFYDDWWNSVNFEDFSKRWNRPVHQFLLRHVYTSSRSAYRISKFQASFFTFLLSACAHELLMA